jgi:ABC transport system ATP-binding/permease protein
MTAERGLSSRTAPALVVRTQGSDRTLQAGASYRIGRDPESDIVVDDSRVSWQHAVLQFDQLDKNAWVLQDVGSTNGTFLGSHRISQITISEDCVLRLGHPQDGPAVTCALAAPARAARPPDAPPAAAPPAHSPPDHTPPAGPGYSDDGPPTGRHGADAGPGYR